MVAPTVMDNPASAGGVDVGAKVSRVAAQSIPQIVDTAISFDTPGYDTNAFVALPGTIFQIPAGKAGKYRFDAWIAFADPASGIGDLARRVKIVRSGGGDIAHQSGVPYAGGFALGNFDLSVSGEENLVVGEQVRLLVSQTNGVGNPLNVVFASLVGRKIDKSG